VARTLPGTRRSVVQGLCFEAERTRCFVVNLAASGVRLDLSEAFARAADLRVEGYHNDDISGQLPPARISETASVSDALIPAYAVVSVEAL
jgi:hypothetical protein